jgi:hypothetical protein
VRTLAFACLLFIAVVGTVQAVHIHGQWLPGKAAMAGAPADASQLPGGEEHCPLCVAMHSTLPVSNRVQPVRLVVVESRALPLVGRAPEAQWHFAMFSRPPPPRENV